MSNQLSDIRVVLYLEFSGNYKMTCHFVSVRECHQGVGSEEGEEGVRARCKMTLLKNIQ